MTDNPNWVPGVFQGQSVGTAEPIASIRKRAEQGQVNFNPRDVLALLDRIAELEKLAHTPPTGSMRYGWEGPHGFVPYPVGCEMTLDEWCAHMTKNGGRPHDA